jgi:hypothetical protein
VEKSFCLQRSQEELFSIVVNPLIRCPLSPVEELSYSINTSSLSLTVASAVSNAVIAMGHYHNPVGDNG